jgi:hypothetical protein
MNHGRLLQGKYSDPWRDLQLYWSYRFSRIFSNSPNLSSIS